MGKIKLYGNIDFQSIYEQAIAIRGDYPIDFTIMYLKIDGLKRNWDLLGSFKISEQEVYVMQSKSSKLYRIGYFVQYENLPHFKEIGELKLRGESVCGVVYSAVELVSINKDYQSRGITQGLYTFLVKVCKLKLLSDEKLYFGARRLWSRLSQSLHLTVDILNTKNCDIKSSVKLTHGKNDYEFDPLVWSYDKTKKHIRLILKDIDEVNITIN